MGRETPLGEDPLCRMYESLIQSSITLDFKQCLSHVLLNEPTGTYHIPTISPSLEICISTSKRNVAYLGDEQLCLQLRAGLLIDCLVHAITSGRSQDWAPYQHIDAR